MWKLQILLTALLGLVISAQVQAQQDGSMTETRAQMDTNNLDKANDTSIGLQWGSLTGVEFKHWLNQERALALGIAFDDDDTAVTLDHLWHFRGGIEAATGLANTNTLVPYIGAGLMGVTGAEDSAFFDRDTDNFGLALRAPIGLEFLPRRVSLGIFAEIAPSYGVAPSGFTYMTADIGARYYF